MWLFSDSVLRCFLSHVLCCFKKHSLSHCTSQLHFHSKATLHFYGTHQIINITTFICWRQSFIFLFFWSQELKIQMFVSDTDRIQTHTVKLRMSPLYIKTNPPVTENHESSLFPFPPSKIILNYRKFPKTCF